MLVLINFFHALTVFLFYYVIVWWVGWGNGSFAERDSLSRALLLGDAAAPAAVLPVVVGLAVGVVEVLLADSPYCGCSSEKNVFSSTVVNVARTVKWGPSWAVTW